ncbi:hypothetical protein [Spiroplasma endosymbiont of Agriotes lineatus]|uniref:hypothetical protein n=1 Tax=Spiroplasma endosymbiont of Agriotes lineatus TaxID=3077930 RepID=UPI0030CBA344
MWKFLSTLNLISVMFISGCNKNSIDLKKYDLEFSGIYNSFLIPSKIGGGAKIKFQDNIDLPLEIKRTHIFSLSLGNKNKDWINFYKNNGVKKNYDDFSYLDSGFGYEISEIIKVKITFTKSIELSYSITSFYAKISN